MNASPQLRESPSLISGTQPLVDFRTEPSRYRHWRLSFDCAQALLLIDVAEDGGLRPGLQFSLRSSQRSRSESDRTIWQYILDAR
jgi:hypothetical protein